MTEMARNAYLVAGQAQNLICTMTESVRRVTRTVRNVLQFLVNIGDVCNDKVGVPHKKCTMLFDDVRVDCMELLSVFSLLCHFLDGFQPLCGLARGCLLLFVKAVLYKNQYLHNDEADDIYMTQQFNKLDRKFSRQG